MESTTYGLNVAAMCLEMPEGPAVLTCDLEFLQVAIPWTMRKDRGITVRVVPSGYGRVEAAGFERAIDGRTKMIVLSSVPWCNGWKADLEAFGRLCQERGLRFCIPIRSVIVARLQEGARSCRGVSGLSSDPARAERTIGARTRALPTQLRHHPYITRYGLRKPLLRHYA